MAAWICRQLEFIKATMNTVRYLEILKSKYWKVRKDEHKKVPRALQRVKNLILYEHQYFLILSKENYR